MVCWCTVSAPSLVSRCALLISKTLQMSKLLVEKQSNTESFKVTFFFASIVFITLVMRNLQPTYHRKSRIQIHPVRSQTQTAPALPKALKNTWLQHNREAFISTLPFPEWKELYSALQHTLSCCNITSLVHSSPT